MALRQHLAVLVSARQAAEVGALAGSGTGNKKCHFWRLRQLRWLRGLLLRLRRRDYQK
jgi:hypothetical protein